MRRLRLWTRLIWLQRTLARRLPAPVATVWDRICRELTPQTYLVGGCVRDLLLGRVVHDWDLTTAAKPEAVAGIFARTIPTGLAHGTITVIQDDCPVEVTTFRREGPYLDGRRPSIVTFDADLEADLSRRDFTINAMALAHPTVKPHGPWFRDPCGGFADLAHGLISAVGDPAARFAEDHLRVLRAYRIAAELGLTLGSETAMAAKEAAATLAGVSAERVRDELSRILLSDNVAWCLEELRQAGVVDSILPELAKGAGFEQNEYHPYDVWQHSVLACAGVAPVLHLRWAALLHDAGKPLTMTVDEEGRRHFYRHEHVGAEIAAQVLERLRYDRETIRRVVHLVRVHMDFHDLPPEAGDGAVRRAAARVGREYLGDLLRLRHADRMAAGKTGHASRGTLKMLARLAELEKAGTALSVADLRIDGHQLMQATGLKPGPAVGELLEQLLDAVIDEPDLNTADELRALARRIVAARERLES